VTGQPNGGDDRLAAAPGRPSGLGPEWVEGADGRLFRSAARVILVDADGRVLLVRGHDVDQPSRSWWFTPGGGIGPDEDPRAAGAREVAEETGFVLEETDLLGPVFRRRAVFDFYRAHCRQDEVFYLARVPGRGQEPAPTATSGWTVVENDVLDEVRWWDLDELTDVGIEVFPHGLAALVRGLLDGWDGVVVQLDDQGTIGA